MASQFSCTAVAVAPSWQLPGGHYVASPLSLTLVAPRSGMASIRYGKAYPGLLYRVPVVAMGGCWPYQYAVSGISGMTVGQHYGDADYGIINWSNPTAGSYSYTLTITDQAGATVSTTVSLTVTTTGFIFFDAVNGSASTANGGTGTGTIANPFKDLDDWYSGTAGHTNTLANRKADATYSGYICYYKAGTYPTANCGTESWNTGLTIGGNRVPMVSDNKPKVHLAYPGTSPVWDVTAAGLQIYADSTYGWWMHGITSTGVNDASDQKFIAMDAGATDMVLFENTFGAQSGTTSNNPCVFMMTANRPSVAQYITVAYNMFQGLSNAEAIELYDTQLCAVHNNTISNSSEGNGGGFYFKEDCAGFSVRRNTALVGNTTCLVRYDNFYTELPNGATQAEICYNNALTTGMSVLFGLDGTSGGTEPNASYGVVGVFRNTWRGQFCQISATNPHGTIDVTGDVNIGDGTASNNWSVSGYLGTLNFDSTYLTGTSAAGIVDANGNLQGSYRTTYLGTRGYEVA